MIPNMNPNWLNSLGQPQPMPTAASDDYPFSGPQPQTMGPRPLPDRNIIPNDLPPSMMQNIAPNGDGSMEQPRGGPLTNPGAYGANNFQPIPSPQPPPMNRRTEGVGFAPNTPPNAQGPSVDPNGPNNYYYSNGPDQQGMRKYLQPDAPVGQPQQMPRLQMPVGMPAGQGRGMDPNRPTDMPPPQGAPGQDNFVPNQMQQQIAQMSPEQREAMRQQMIAQLQQTRQSIQGPQPAFTPTSNIPSPGTDQGVSMSPRPSTPFDPGGGPGRMYDPNTRTATPYSPPQAGSSPSPISNPAGPRPSTPSDPGGGPGRLFDPATGQTYLDPNRFLPPPPEPPSRYFAPYGDPQNVYQPRGIQGRPG